VRQVGFYQEKKLQLVAVFLRRAIRSSVLK